jgi:hypothetical protein
MATLDEIAKTSRSMRASLGLTRQRLDAYLILTDKKDAELIGSAADVLSTLAVVNAVHVRSEKQRSELPVGCLSSVVSPSIEAFYPVAGVVDLSKELIKMEAEVAKLQKQVDLLEKKMSAGVYKEKTPPEVQEEHKQKVANLLDEQGKIGKTIAQFEGLLTPTERAGYRGAKIDAAQKSIALAQKQLDKILGKVKPGKEPNKKTQGLIANKTKELEAAQALLASLQG